MRDQILVTERLRNCTGGHDTSALEVRSRRGAIQIRVYLYLYTDLFYFQNLVMQHYNSKSRPHNRLQYMGVDHGGQGDKSPPEFGAGGR